MKNLFILSVLYIFSAVYIFAETQPVFLVEKVDMSYYSAPRTVDENIRNLHCNSLAMSGNEAFDFLQKFELHKSFLEGDFSPEMTLVYDHYLISFDLTEESKFFSWQTNFNWFNSNYNKWQKNLKEIEFYKAWGLDKILKNDYKKLNDKIVSFNSAYIFGMNERVDAQVRVFDMNSQKLIADYRVTPSTPGIYDGPMVMFFTPKSNQITIKLAVRLDQLPNELSELKQQLSGSK